LTIKRRNFVKGAASGVAAGVLSTPLAACAGNKKPNVVFIMADDLGFGDLSCFGRPDYETPVLDKLAEDGIKMVNTYANSAVCSPTRTALLTGQYQYRHRVGLEEPMGSADDLGLSDSQPTIAREFQSAGYNTALVGKWHLGYAPDFGPLKSGYDHFFGFYPGGVDYFSHKLVHGKVSIPGFSAPPRDGLWRDDKEPVSVEGYATDVFGDQAQSYIEEFAKEKEPFFLSLHFNAPHWPWEGPNDVSRSRDLTTIFDFDGGNLEIYGHMVRSLDANVGRIVDKLKQLGIEDNTIIVFTSDNGGERFSYNWPFLGKKGELLEGGIRVPGIVKWPNAIEAGTESDQVITSMDWMPTLLAAAGIKPSKAFKGDGENLLPVLSGHTDPVKRTLYWRFKANEQMAVRDENWKYLKLKGNEYLFDLSTDEREQANLLRVHPKKVEQLRTMYAEWNSEMLPYPEDSFSGGGEYIYTDRY